MTLKGLDGYVDVGRELLELDQPVLAHDRFNDWVRMVGSWLTKVAADTGLAALWVQLPGSDLVLGGQYSTEYEDWVKFKAAVRARMAWLAKLPEAAKMHNALPVSAQADAQERGRNEHTGDIEFAGVKAKEKDMQPFQAEAVNKRRVFVVHGRNMQARDAMFALLRAIDLDPIEWEEAIEMADEISPYIGHVLDIAFSKAQAAVVLLSGEDMARLGRRYVTPADQEYEKRLTPQARPNVIFEMGMAFGKYPDRTLIIELGFNRPFTDTTGRNTIRFSDNPASRKKIADRLKTAGCHVRTESRSDWLTAGDFASALHAPDLVGGEKHAGLLITRRHANPAEAYAYRIFYMYDQFATGQPQDYKDTAGIVKGTKQYQQLDAFGNFNYGAVGGALGLSPTVLQFAAGTASFTGILTKTFNELEKYG